MKTRRVQTTKTPPITCPACQYQLTAATGIGRPSPGDFSICAGCGSLLRFDGTMRLRRALPEEESAADPETWRAAALAVRDKRGTRH